MSIINLLVTNRCNLNCNHCFRSTAGTADLPIHLAKKIVLESEALNFKDIIFTGGEPALYPHLKELVAYISGSNRMRFSIVTNGLDIGPYIRIIKKYRRHFAILGISMDDLPDSDHLTRDHSLLAAYDDTFQLCREHKVPFQVKSCISKMYVDSVDEFISIAEKNGAVGIEFSTIMPSKKALKKDLVMPMQHRMALMNRILSLAAKTTYPISFAQELFLSNPIACERQRMQQFCFDTEGNLVFCTCLSDYFQSVPELTVGNIETASFRDLIVQYHCLQNAFLAEKMAKYSDYATQSRLYDYQNCLYCYDHFKCSRLVDIP